MHHYWEHCCTGLKNKYWHYTHTCTHTNVCMQAHTHTLHTNTYTHNTSPCSAFVPQCQRSGKLILVLLWRLLPSWKSQGRSPTSNWLYHWTADMWSGTRTTQELYKESSKITWQLSCILKCTIFNKSIAKRKRSNKFIEVGHRNDKLWILLWLCYMHQFKY